MRGRFGFIGILLIAALGLLVGGIAYSWGLAAGTAQVVAPGAVVPVVYTPGWGFGFGFGGILFFLLIVGLLMAAFRARRWAGGPGGWGHGGMGHGPWASRFDATDPRVRHWMEGDVPPQFRPMLDSWHQRAHGSATGPDTGGPVDGGDSSAGPAHPIGTH